MKKHLMAITLSIMTVFTCLVLWLTPMFAFDEVIVINETGDETLLEGKTVSGSFFYTDIQESSTPPNIRFDWFDGDSQFLGEMSQALLLEGRNNAKQRVIQAFPFYNRPNLEGLRLIQTAGDLQVWVGVETEDRNDEADSRFKLVVIDMPAKTFQTLKYELHTQPSNLPKILSYAQPNENELNILLKDANDYQGNTLVELQIALPSLTVKEVPVDFSGQDDLYLNSPYLENELVAPKKYLFYLTNSYSRSGSYGDSSDLVEGLVLMEPQTHQTQILTQETLEVKVDGVDYDLNHMVMHGDQLFMYASSQKADFGVNLAEAPAARIFKYVANDFESIHAYDTDNFNYSLRHGIFYQSYAVEDKVVRLAAFDPSVGEVVYQADFQIQTDQDIQMNPLYVD